MTPELFFLEHLPRAWNARLSTLSDERRATLRDLSFELEIELSSGAGQNFHLRVRDGEMQPVEQRAAHPLVTLVLDVDAFEELLGQLGKPALARLAELGGGSTPGLSAASVAALRELRGSIRLDVSGARPWSIRLHCGPGPIPDPPDTTLQLSSETWEELISGQLEPQAALLTGQLALEGKLDLPLRLALALVRGD
ncbi:MAG: SCP2 sterol-binding domain-containing protein [Myxococcota bacterium]